MYCGVEVLNVVEVDPPQAGPGQLVVRVKATGINPGEAKIRQGLMHERWPATFPSGQGSDLAGVVEQTGDWAHHRSRMQLLSAITGILGREEYRPMLDSDLFPAQVENHWASPRTVPGTPTTLQP